jgi:hypothetical protein
MSKQWQQALYQGMCEITGEFLLIMTELIDVDCANVIARCLLRVAMMRYWHFRMLSLADDCKGHATVSYVNQLISNYVVIERVEIRFTFNWQITLFIDKIAGEGLIRCGTIESNHSGYFTGRIK